LPNEITFRTSEDAKYIWLNKGRGTVKRRDTEAQVTTCPYMKFAEGIVLTRFTIRVIIICEVLR